MKILHNKNITCLSFPKWCCNQEGQRYVVPRFSFCDKFCGITFNIFANFARDDGEILLEDIHKKLLHWWENYGVIDWQNRELD